VIGGRSWLARSRSPRREFRGVTVRGEWRARLMLKKRNKKGILRIGNIGGRKERKKEKIKKKIRKIERERIRKEE